MDEDVRKGISWPPSLPLSHLLFIDYKKQGTGNSGFQDTGYQVTTGNRLSPTTASTGVSGSLGSSSGGGKAEPRETKAARGLSADFQQGESCPQGEILLEYSAGYLSAHISKEITEGWGRSIP